MDDQGAMRKLNQQVFAAPRRAQNGLSSKICAKARRERPAQAFAAQYDVFDDAVFQVRRDAAPGDFDFREFRHG